MTEKRPNDSIKKSSNNEMREMRRPRGFTPGASGPSGENSREQGWQLNEEQRSNAAKSMQGKTGGRDYEYGARDFGDTPEDTGSAPVESRPEPRMVSSKPRGQRRT